MIVRSPFGVLKKRRTATTWLTIGQPACLESLESGVKITPPTPCRSRGESSRRARARTPPWRAHRRASPSARRPWRWRWQWASAGARIEDVGSFAKAKPRDSRRPALIRRSADRPIGDAQRVEQLAIAARRRMPASPRRARRCVRPDKDRRRHRFAKSCNVLQLATAASTATLSQWPRASRSEAERG